MKMFNLEGKCALVTGASGAIGASVVRVLHHHGATLALAGRRSDALEMLAESLGERCHVLVADLADSPALADLPHRAADALGRVDILVNNAGLTRDGLAVRMKDDEWHQVLDVNLSAAFKLSRACLRGMMKTHWGRIISISSTVGLTGNIGQANYTAAKAGLIGLSKSLAAEVASRGVTVNCVAPGFITSPMTDAIPKAAREKILARIPVGRVGEADEVAAAVLYLASPQAAYVTGQTLHVNGGLAMI